MSTFVCASEDMHPYECDGPGKCRHCDARNLGDMCAACRENVVAEGEDLCAACLAEVFPEPAA